MSHPSTTQVEEKAPRATPGRAKRLKRSRRIGLAVLLGLTLTIGVGVVKAIAWTAGVVPSTGCEGTDFNGTVGNEPGTHKAVVKFAGETKDIIVPAEGGNSFTLHFKSHEGGPWSYTGTWSKSSEVETASGALQAVTDCQPTTTTSSATTTPPTTAPPVKEQPKPVYAGTATDKKRTVRTEPTPDDSPELGTPPPTEELGALPFTGPEDGDQQIHPDRMMFLFFLGLLGIGLVTTGRILLIKARLHRSKEGDQG